MEPGDPGKLPGPNNPPGNKVVGALEGYASGGNPVGGKMVVPNPGWPKACGWPYIGGPRLDWPYVVWPSG